MLEFILLDGNKPFLIAACVVLLIGALEIGSLLLGLGLSDMIEDLLPDFEADADVGGIDAAGADIDLDGIDADGDLAIDAVDGADGDGDAVEPSDSFIGAAFSWLNAGRVPLLVLLIIMLSSFAVIGFSAQVTTASLLPSALVPLPALLAATPAFILMLPATRSVSRGIAKILPREETYAVDAEAFIGRTATVTLGPVTRRRPGKAKCIGPHGDLNFLRVRAAQRRQSYAIGEEVLLTSRRGQLYDVIAAPAHLQSPTRE